MQLELHGICLVATQSIYPIEPIYVPGEGEKLCVVIGLNLVPERKYFKDLPSILINLCGHS